MGLNSFEYKDQFVTGLKDYYINIIMLLDKHDGDDGWR